MFFWRTVVTKKAKISRQTLSNKLCSKNMRKAHHVQVVSTVKVGGLSNERITGKKKRDQPIFITDHWQKLHPQVDDESQGLPFRSNISRYLKAVNLREGRLEQCNTLQLCPSSAPQLFLSWMSLPMCTLFQLTAKLDSGQWDNEGH